MKIGSYQKSSRTEYPGKTAAVVFTQGCNWRCPFCHNRALVVPARFQPPIPVEQVLSYLRDARGGIDAVVITGGEPTLQPGLLGFLRAIRSYGLAIKLDTNGSRPTVLANLFNEGLLDYVAMDLKGPISTYARFTGCSVETGMVELSLELVRTSGVPYELRTTLVGGLHTTEDINELAPLIRGAKRYVVQSYRPPVTPSKAAEHLEPPSPSLFHEAGVLLRDHVDEFLVR